MAALTVRQLLETVDTVVSRRWPTPIEVEGELAQVTLAASGHAYLSLREASPGPVRPVAQISAVCWRSTWSTLRYRPEEGARVVVRGRLGVWMGRGNVQLQILSMSPAGEGALAREIAARRARLEADGLLDPRRKRDLPAVPRFIGVATSLQGAALQDFLEVSRQRWPACRILVAGCVVQGDAAPASVVQAVELLLDDGRSEVIVVTRGGGSREDLLAFQDEGLARYLAQVPVPVISAVGHQIDETLCDLVADLAVATPTEAAVRVLPDASALMQQLDDGTGRLVRAARAVVQRRRDRVEGLQRRLRHPRQRLEAQRAQVASAAERLVVATRRAVREGRRRVEASAPRLATALAVRVPAARRSLDQARGRLVLLGERQVTARQDRLRALVAQLEALGPQRVLERGYAVVTGPQGVVMRPNQAPAGVSLTIRLRDGWLRASSEGEPPEEGR